MVKPASRRSKKFKEAVDPDRIKKILENVKPGMVEKQSKYFAQIVLVEEKAKRILEEAGVPSYQIAQYLIVARQCYSIASKFREGTRDLEAQNVVNHWNMRGLDGILLRRVCEISGCNTTSPGPGFVPAHTHVRADITDFAHTHVFADITDTIADAQAPQFFLLDCSRFVAGHFRSDADTRDIGSSTYRWRRIFHKSYIDGYVESANHLFRARTRLWPRAVNTSAFAQLQLETEVWDDGLEEWLEWYWRIRAEEDRLDFSLAGDILMRFQSGVGFFTGGGGIFPLTPDAQNIGGILSRWKDVHLSGDIKSVTDIIALAGGILKNWNHLELDEITTPGAVADHGKVYTKNDNKLYFQDGAGIEHEVALI